MRLEQAKIDQIRQHSDIVDVLGHYLTIQRKGRSFSAICPFHQDHDPSLSISQEKQIFKCFVCGASGNVFQFVQQFEKVHFIEAVATVAKLSNIELDIDLNQTFTKKRVLLPEVEALQAACEFYQYQLNSNQSSVAYQYLQARGLKANILEHFKIGYASLESNNICKFLLKKGFSETVLLKNGIAHEKNNILADTFYDRIMFPISNEYGEVVGFSARTLHADVKPKYINSSDNEVFKKSQLLYHYFEAKESIKNSKNVFILEGMMDVVALYQAGIPNCIALMGTALTKFHLDMIRKLTRVVTLCFDADKAGIQATLKAIALCESANLLVKVVLLDDKKDPDDILKENGPDYLVSLLNRPLSSREYEIKMYSRQLDLNNYEDRKRLTMLVMPKIMQVTDPLDYDYLISQVSQLTGFRPEMLRNEFSQQTSSQPMQSNLQVVEPEYVPIEHTRSHQTKYIRAEQELLWYMVTSNLACQMYAVDLGMMYKPEHRKLANYIVDYRNRHGDFEFADLLSSLEQKPHLVKELTEISWIAETLPIETTEQALKEYISTIHSFALKQRRDDLRHNMRQATRHEDKVSIAQEIISLEKELKK